MTSFARTSTRTVCFKPVFLCEIYKVFTKALLASAAVFSMTVNAQSSEIQPSIQTSPEVAVQSQTPAEQPAQSLQQPVQQPLQQSLQQSSQRSSKRSSKQSRVALKDVVLKRFMQADLVSVAKVASISDLVNTALSVPGLIAVQAYVYTFEPLMNWKGDKTDFMRVRVDLSDCHKRLQSGEEYLLFSQFTDAEYYRTYHCDDLIEREKAIDIIASLEQIRAINVAEHKKEKPSSI